MRVSDVFDDGVDVAGSASHDDQPCAGITHYSYEDKE
jgi:hypothetical protein